MLNPSQKRAVEHFGKPLLVIAGAGSGKTRTLAYKLEHLITKKGINPDRILLITFTNKAGKELKDRAKKTTGLEIPWVGTFHSIALRILRQDGKLVGIDPTFTVIDEEDKRRLLKSLISQMGLGKEFLELAESYLFARRENLSEPKDETLESIYRAYVRTLREQNLMDFSGLMSELYRLLKEYPERWKNFFEFIMVDEFQDTNHIQYEILKLLARENVCVVGDPNQCIYEWRYARPDNILRFREDFNPDIIKLEYNYRSKRYIIEVANAVLRKSQAEWKDLIPILRATREGEEKPIVRRFESVLEESIWIAQEIKRLINTYQPSQIAILLRTGYLTDSIERALFNARIPYKIVGTVRFFERAEIKDSLAFLKVLVNPSDELSIKRCLENLGLSEKFLEYAKRHYQGNWITALSKVLSLADINSKRKWESFLGAFKELKSRSDEYEKALREFLEKIGYLEYVKVKYKKDHEERWENLKELFRFLEEKKKEGQELYEVLEEISLIGQEEDTKEGVSIMTIHASKGLEFPVVFLPRLEDGVLPHEKSLNTLQEIEEERRLFYVAITRAKDLLYLTYTREKGAKPSRFLSDIPKEYLDLSAFRVKKTTYKPELRSVYLKVGDKVRHRIFGVGQVIEIEGERAKVDFGDKVKTIHTAFLEVLHSSP